MPQQEETISWQVHSRREGERSTDWYWGLGLLALLGAGLSIFFGNILLAIILVVAAGSVGVLAARDPREHTARIDKRGVTIDGTLYPYPSLQSFWVDLDEEGASGGQRRLFVTTFGILSPHFTLQLTDRAHAETVRSYLKKFLKEEEQGPHFGEHLAEILDL